MGLENPLHIAILLVILLLLFGAKRLPEMGKGLGSGIRGFKDGLTSSSTDDAPETPAAPPALNEAPPAPVSESADKKSETVNAA